MIIDVFVFGYLVPHFCSKSSRQHVQRMALNWETMLDTSAPPRLLPISDGVSPVQWGLGDFIFVVYFILLQPTKFVFTAVSTTVEHGHIVGDQRTYICKLHLLWKSAGDRPGWPIRQRICCRSKSCRHHLSHYLLAAGGMPCILRHTPLQLRRAMASDKTTMITTSDTRCQPRQPWFGREEAEKIDDGTVDFLLCTF